MSHYGLGVELASSAVRWSTATSLTEVSTVVELVPVVAVAGGRLIGGSAGAAAALAVPGSVVTDVVGQFTVDRLWFVGTMMVTPDDALRAAIAGCVDDATQANGSAPTAFTIACPSAWDEAAIRRLRAIIDSLGLVLPNARLDVSATTAAGDAASRIPERHAVEIDSALPPLPIANRPVISSASPVTTPEPVAAPRRRRWGMLGWLLVVLGIPAVVVIVVRAGREDSAASTDTTTGSSLGSVDTQPLVSTSTLPALVSPLTIGFLTVDDAASQTAVQSEVASLAADTASFPSGVFVVAQPLGSDPAATIEQLRGQGVTVVVAAVAGDGAAPVAAASQAAHAPLCLVGASPDGITGVGIAFGTPTSCVDLLALASIAASSSEGTRVAAAMGRLVGGDGLQCSTVAQCAAYLQAAQPISFEPDGEAVQLAPEG